MKKQRFENKYRFRRSTEKNQQTWESGASNCERNLWSNIFEPEGHSSSAEIWSKATFGVHLTERLLSTPLAVWWNGIIICSIFGHFKQLKFVQNLKSFAKLDSTFGQITNKALKYCQRLVKICQVEKITKSYHTYQRTIYTVEKMKIKISTMHGALKFCVFLTW